VVKYDGYLAPHVDLILTRREAGLLPRAIAGELYEIGVRSPGHQMAAAKSPPLSWWDEKAIERINEIEAQAHTVRYILDKAGLLTPPKPAKVGTFVTALTERRRRNRPIDRDEDQRDRWHVWGP